MCIFFVENTSSIFRTVRKWWAAGTSGMSVNMEQCARHRRHNGAAQSSLHTKKVKILVVNVRQPEWKRNEVGNGNELFGNTR